MTVTRSNQNSPRSAEKTGPRTAEKNGPRTAEKNGPRTAEKNGPRTAEKNGPRTAERILDIAERLVQSRGFNNFSYADVATELGITKASLHYHFPGKAELGQALITRYAQRFFEAVARIDRDLAGSPAKLEAYSELYAGVLRGERMCMCGILAAEYQTLPAPMRNAVIEFFDENQRWLADVLTAGKTERTLRFTAPAEEVAQGILSTLEGAMLVARPYGDVARFDSAARQLLESITV